MLNNIQVNNNSLFGALFLTASCLSTFALFKLKKGFEDYEIDKIKEIQKAKMALKKQMELERKAIEDSHIKIKDDAQFYTIKNITKYVNDFLKIIQSMNSIQTYAYYNTHPAEQTLRIYSTLLSQMMNCMELESKFDMPHGIYTSHGKKTIETVRKFHSRAKYILGLENGLSMLEKATSFLNLRPSAIEYCILTKLMCGMCRMNAEFEREYEVAKDRIEKINQLESFGIDDFDNTEFIYYSLVKSLLVQEKYDQALEACFLLENFSKNLGNGAFSIVSMKYLVLIYLYMGDLNSAIEYARKIIKRSQSSGFTFLRSPLLRTRKYIFFLNPEEGENFLRLSVRRIRLVDNEPEPSIPIGAYLSIQYLSEDFSEVYMEEERELQGERQIDFKLLGLHEFVTKIDQPIMMYIEIFKDSTREIKLGEHLQPLLPIIIKAKYEVKDLFD